MDVTVERQSLIYTLTKSILLYRPQNVLDAIFTESQSVLTELKSFLKIRINENIHLEHKEAEVNAFREGLKILNRLEGIKLTIDFQWKYEIIFFGLKLLIEEMNISNKRLSLTIDKEGAEENDSRTLQAAKKVGFTQAKEELSTKEKGLRMADFLCGFSGRIIRALQEETRYTGCEFKEIKLLSSSWFRLSSDAFNLYKKIATIFFRLNNYYYQSYTGIYMDGVITFFRLFSYIDSYQSYEDFKHIDADTHAKCFNDYICQELQREYRRFGMPDSKEFLF